MRSLLLSLVCLVVGTPIATATPLAWTVTGSVSNAALGYGPNGPFSGTFVYDPDSNAVLSWNISLAAGFEGPYSCPPWIPQYECMIVSASVDPTGTIFDFTEDDPGADFSMGLELVTAGPLTDAGGVISWVSGSLGGSGSTLYMPFGAEPITGYVSTPEPGALDLVIFGFGVLVPAGCRKLHSGTL